MFSKIATVTTVALASSLVAAQTHSDCNPVKGDKCSPDPAFGGSVSVDFTQGENDLFKAAEGTTLKYDGSKGAVFTINKDTDAPTISSTKFLFFGQVEVVAQGASGAGIVTSSVLQSDDLDEIDWEWVGGDNAQVQTNYFSKGDTTTYDRGGFSKVPSPLDSFHTYTLDWTKDSVKWSVDGTVVRTLDAATAKGGFPQTPMQVKLGTWVAGRKDAPKGTVDWAGGLTDFSKAPFVANYKSIKIVDYCGGDSECKGAKSYAYSDNSGNWQSIKVDGSSGSGSGSGSITTSSTISVPTATNTSTDTATQSTAPKTSGGIGFVGNGSGSNSTTGGSGSGSSSGSVSGSQSGSAATSSSTVAPNSGVKGAASIVTVAAGLLLSYLVL